jgi:GNAT superfamily N-acetyltransferase
MAAAPVDRLYLLRPAQRRGIGRRLMVAAGRLLSMHDLRPLSVWTLECNRPAQVFYERLGGRPLPRRPVFEDQGAPVFEVGFRWERPESLSELSASRW